MNVKGDDDEQNINLNILFITGFEKFIILVFFFIQCFVNIDTNRFNKPTRI